MGAISAVPGVFPRPSRLAGRDFCRRWRITAPKQAGWARFRHSQAYYRAQAGWLGAISALPGVFPRPSRLAGRDFGRRQW